jgi:hypothetical protein
VKVGLQFMPHCLKSGEQVSPESQVAVYWTKAAYPFWHVRDPLAGVGHTVPELPQLSGLFVVVAVQTWFKQTRPVAQPLSSPAAFELQPQAEPLGEPAALEEPAKHAFPSEER